MAVTDHPAPPDQDRAERRTRRRFARRQWARRWLSLRYVVVSTLLVALVATGVWFVYFSAATQVKRVDISGNKLLSATVLRRASGVQEGEQLALVDLDRASSRLGALAEVQSVEVTRSWPDAVEVRVVERTAIAVVELGGRLRGLDKDGVVFRDYRTLPAGLPRVRPSAAAPSDALEEAAAVVSALPGELSRRVDHVEVETIDRITLVMRDGREVLWGSADESEQKAQVLEVLLRERGRVFDVSVPGSPTAR